MAVDEVPIELPLSRFLDGEMEPDDGRALIAAMAEDLQFAGEIRRLLLIDGLLRQAADLDPDVFTDSIRTRIAAEEDGDCFARALSERLQPSHLSPRARPGRKKLLLTVLTCAFAISGLALALWIMEPTRTPNSNNSQPLQSNLNVQPVAIVVGEANARFAAGATPKSGAFATGQYLLQSGIVHLRFSSGAELVVRSPARFNILDPMNLVLSEGVLRAIVPSSAHGFTIHTAQVNFEDLGTEFGLAVGKQPDEIQMHVFEGRVELKTERGERLTLVENGQSMQVTKGKPELTTLKQLDQFPSPDAIGTEKWLKWQEQFEKDPDLVFYYPFNLEPLDPELLKDHATNSKHLDGHIIGARWVTGRWPGKQALLFDRDSDHVKVPVPGEFRKLTIIAWAKLDRCDFALNALFDSDGWRPGALHWQITRSGDCTLGQWGKSRRRLLGSPIPFGRWTHLAAVVDLDRSATQTYVNGEIVEDVRLSSSSGAVTPGSCRIGDWLRHPEFTSIPHRGLRGRIDELALLQRALTQAEIRDIVAAGTPAGKQSD